MAANHERISFGKYEGRLYSEVPTDYLLWLLDGQGKGGSDLYKARSGRYRLDLAHAELTRRGVKVPKPKHK